MHQYNNYNKGINYNLKQNFENVVKKFEIFIFSILSLLLIISTKINPNIQKKINKVFIDISLPINQIINTPINNVINLIDYINFLINAKNENISLKEENEKLKSLYLQYINIKKENEELQSILNFSRPYFANFTAGQIIGKTNQVFSSRIFVKINNQSHKIIKSSSIEENSQQSISKQELENQGNIKKLDEIRNNAIVFGKISMIGRIINIDDDKALVMLVNDEKSRIPVISSQSRVRAIIAGNNSDIMKLIYLPKNHNIKAGEQIFSSGDGESIIAGLLIGVVSKVSNNQVEVKMVENVYNLSFVGIK